MSATATAPASGATDSDPYALRRFLDGPYHAVKQRVRDRLAEQRFAPVTGLDREQYRDQVMRWMVELAESGETKILFPEERSTAERATTSGGCTRCR